MLGLAKVKRARFLLASTSEVYGDPQVHPQPEHYWGHVNPIGPRGVYDEAKRYAEALTMAYHRQQGVNTCIARVFNTFGARMRPHDGRAIPTFLRQALQDKPVTVFGEGSQTRSFCYVDDLIRGFVLLSESDVHLPVNLGNPKEMTLLELAEAVIDATGSRSEIVYEALPVDDPQVRQPDITRAKQLLGWEPEVELRDGLHGRSSRPASSGSSAPRMTERASDGERARSQPGTRRERCGASRARLRIAHLTATFPPYPGGAGNTAYRFAKGQAERGHHVEVFTAPAEGEAPDPGEALVHRIKPVFAIGNAPLIPSLAGIDGFDVVHVHYPFIFGSELTLLGRLRAPPAAAGPPYPLQEPPGREGAPPGPVRGLRAHRRAAAGQCRGPHLRPLRRPRRIGAVPEANRRAGSLQADRDAEWRRCRALRSRPGRRGSEGRGGHPG